MLVNINNNGFKFSSIIIASDIIHRELHYYTEVKGSNRVFTFVEIVCICFNTRDFSMHNIDMQQRHFLPLLRSCRLDRKEKSVKFYDKYQQNTDKNKTVKKKAKTKDGP